MSSDPVTHTNPAATTWTMLGNSELLRRRGDSENPLTIREFVSGYSGPGRDRLAALGQRLRDAARARGPHDQPTAAAANATAAINAVATLGEPAPGAPGPVTFVGGVPHVRNHLLDSPLGRAAHGDASAAVGLVPLHLVHPALPAPIAAATDAASASAAEHRLGVLFDDLAGLPTARQLEALTHALVDGHADLGPVADALEAAMRALPKV